MPKDKQTAINSIWESNSKDVTFKIVNDSTNKKLVDGVNILGVAVGKTFFPNTVSRNGIYYPKEEWENAINDPDFQYRLKNNLVFGTIGHDIDLTDTEIRQGLLSHIITDVWIDNNIGYAKYLILNTKPGKVLNLLLRANSKLSTSTRANGVLVNSNDRLEARDLVLERIDFVIDPGYVNAKPELIESLNKGKQDMPLESKIDKIDAAVKLLESQVQQVNNNNVNLNNSNNNQQTLLEAVSNIRTEFAESKATIKLYEQFGSPFDVSTKLNKLKLYEAIGENPAEISQVLEDAEDTIEDLTNKVTELSIKNSLMNEKDTPEKVKTELKESEDNDELTKFKELIDTPEKLDKLLDAVEAEQNELEKYRAIGTPEDIKKAISDDIASKIAQSENVDTEIVESLLKSGVSPKKAKSMIRSIKENLGDFNDEDMLDDYLDDSTGENSLFDYLDEEDNLENPEEEEEEKSKEKDMSIQEAISRRKNMKAGSNKIKSKRKVNENKQFNRTNLVENLISRNKTAKRSKRTNLI